jgi:CelD/BcsL family acetyltransferase involved in cellulose biosynthesis
MPSPQLPNVSRGNESTQQGVISALVAPFPEIHDGDLLERWSELSSSAPPFLTPEFFMLNRALRREGEAYLAEAWRDGSLVGAMPLVFESHRALALTTDHTPGYDYCGEPDGIDAIWDALSHDPRWDVMSFRNVPSASPLATRLAPLAQKDGCPTKIYPAARHPVFSLGNFEASLSPKFLANVRRCGRKAGGVELERLTLPTQADFDEAFAIEAMAWKGAAGTGIANDHAVTQLYVSLIRTFGERGRAALYFLKCGTRRVATLLSVETNQTLYALKIGYDPHDYALSPGHLMVWQVARDAEHRGLRQFDFVGHQDAWKRKWTEEADQQVSLTIYRHSPEGILLWGLSELKQHLPARLHDLRTPLRYSCQRSDIIGSHSSTERVRGRLGQGMGIKSAIRRALSPAPPPQEPLGEVSRFAEGTWVRVKSEPEVRATLRAGDRLRGLLFAPTQWAECGAVHRVQKHVRRILDDKGRMRPVSGTVLLDGLTCAGHDTEPRGCGRHCPMMFRDEWLEPTEPPRRSPPGPSPLRHARVRSIDNIRGGLDLFGRRDGLTFMPEMEAYCDRRFHISGRLPQVFEYDRWTPTRAPVYVLEGLACTGRALGSKGPCDRSCALLWHADWLEIEPAPPPPSRTGSGLVADPEAPIRSQPFDGDRQGGPS